MWIDWGQPALLFARWGQFEKRSQFFYFEGVVDYEFLAEKHSANCEHYLEQLQLMDEVLGDTWLWWIERLFCCNRKIFPNIWIKSLLKWYPRYSPILASFNLFLFRKRWEEEEKISGGKNWSRWLFPVMKKWYGLGIEQASRIQVIIELCIVDRTSKIWWKCMQEQNK